MIQQQQQNKSKELEERGLGMATQILSKRKSGEEEEEELENNYKLKKIIKQQCSSSSSSMIQQQHQHSSLSSWSDLDSDILREINKKLCNYEDHIGFRGVCKSWRAAGRVERAGDVLPWLITLHVDSFENKLRYKLYEPEFLPENKLVVQGLLPFLTHQEEEEELENNYKIKKKIKQQYCSSSSMIQQQHQNKSSPFKSEDKSRESCTIRKLSAGTIKLKDYFNNAVTQPPTIFRYVDGWLHISVFNYKSKVSYFLFFSVATKASFTLPQLNDSTVSLFLALSTTPADSPDCVFLTLWLTNDYTIRVGIFRHGDTHWTITESVRGDWVGRSRVRNAVLVGGVFYFLTTTAGIGSYDLATGALRVDHFSTGKLEFIGIISFFGLDGDLMLVYQKKQTPKDYFHDCRKNKAAWVNPQQTQKLCISKYDWMNKVWAPLQTLGGRSLYLNYGNCVYVDYINYYRGVSSSSGNKIYIRRVGQISYVDEYTLEDEAADGQLSQCPSPTLVRWAGPRCIESAMWVRPPPILMSF